MHAIRKFGLLLSKTFKVLGYLSNILALNVPDEGNSRQVSLISTSLFKLTYYKTWDRNSQH